MALAPVLLFVYSRVDHTRKTIESLMSNILASETDLIIFSDAASNVSLADAVNQVREYIRTITGFKSLTIHYRPYNYGLSRSIISGVSAHLL